MRQWKLGCTTRAGHKKYTFLLNTESLIESIDFTVVPTLTELVGKGGGGGGNLVLVGII